MCMKGDMEKSDNGRGEEENDALWMRKKKFLSRLPIINSASYSVDLIV